MRYRRYISTKQSDGSTVVVSHGPVIGFYRLLYRPFLLFFLIGFLWEFFSLHFATAGAFLLFFAVLMPRRVRSPRG